MNVSDVLRACAQSETGTYWEKNGRYQKLADELMEMVPGSGTADNEFVELVRVSCNIYYDWYNNGGGNMCDKGPLSGLVADLSEAESKIRPLLKNDEQWDTILSELQICAAEQVCEECDGSQLMECSSCHGEIDHDDECPACEDTGEEDCQYCDDQVEMSLCEEALEGIIDAVLIYSGEGLGLIDKDSETGIIGV